MGTAALKPAVLRGLKFVESAKKYALILTQMAYGTQAVW